jgi:glutamyl/glutaminyl-tRNA synthetase
MVRTRFAPSPTGFLHVGGFRTALYAFALARHFRGQFILRIEDTDQSREVVGATQALQDTLKKFGLVWDKFYIQSQRLDLYQKKAAELIKKGQAFYCQCDSHELRNPCRDKGYTSGAVRLRVPDNKTLTYHDFVHKKDVSWNTNNVYDATLLKSDGFPTYHLAAMVDDIEMEITHILRGHDWLPSTPIHLLVFEHLAEKRPEMGHLSDILSSQTGKKLSKRRDSVFVEKFLEEGYLPEALLNFVMLLGWAPKNNRETYTLEEFVQEFDINGFQESNPRFEDKKLKWFNGYYIRQKTDAELLSLAKLYCPEITLEIIPLVKERINNLTEIKDLVKFFFVRPPKIAFEKAKDMLKDCQWTKEEIEKAIAGQDKDFYMNLRLAVCGQRITPPLTESMIILGKAETLERL